MAKRCTSGREYRETCLDTRNSVSTRKLVATRNPGNSGDSKTEGNDEDWPHNLHILSNYVLHVEKVFSIVRQRYGRSPTDQIKDLDVNTAIWIILMSLTLLGMIMRKIFDLPRINQGNLWDNYVKWLKGWSRISQKLPDWPRLIGSSLCWEKHLCYVIELFDLQLPKPTSFLTRCFVWEVSVTNQSKPEKAGLNGFWKHVITKIWIGFGSDRRRADGVWVGKFPRIHYVGNSRRGSKMMTKSKCEPEQFRGRIIFLSTYSDIVNVQWHFIGESEEIMKIVLRVWSKIHVYFRQSGSVSTEQWRIYVENQPETHEVQENPPRMRIGNQWWYRQNFLLAALFLRLMRKFNESCCVDASGDSQNSWTTEIDQTLLQRWLFEECWQRTIPHYTWWRRTWRYENIMSRVYIASTWGNIPREWVDSWKHEDRSSPGCASLLSSRTLRCWDHDRIFISVSWVRIVNGINKYVTETSEEIPVASVENGGTWQLCHESWATTKADANIVSCVYSLSWTKMDRRWSTRLFEVSKLMIRLLRHGETIPREDDGAERFDDLIEKFKVKFDGTSPWSIDAWITFLAEGGGQKKRFQYCLNPNSSKHFLYFRAIQGHSGGTPVDPTVQDNVLLPDDSSDYIHHIGNAHDMHSIIQGGLIPGGRGLKRDRQSVFFTAVNPMYANQDLEKVQFDLGKPRIAVFKNTWRAHQNTAYWCNLKLAQRKGLQFYQTRSHAIALSTDYLRIVLRKWYTWRLERIKTARYTYTQGYRESYSRQIRNMDVRILLIPKRENPPTITANKASSAVTPVAHFSRTHVASIPEKVSEVSTGNPVAVTSTTEFKV